MIFNGKNKRQENEKWYGSILRWLRPIPTSVSLDIGSSSIKILKMAHGETPSILNLAEVPLPPGVIINGDIARPNTLKESVQSALELSGIKKENIRTCPINKNLVVRKFDFPAMSHKEVASALELQLEEVLPFPLDNAVYDYITLNSKDDIANLMLFAGEKAPIVKQVQLLAELGLTVQVVDVAPYIVKRLINFCGATEDNPGELTIALDVGASTTDISIFDGAQVLFFRDIPTAGRAFTNAVMEAHQNSFQDAEELKITKGLELVAVADTANDLFRDIWRSIMYVLSRSNYVVGDVYLLGGSSALKGFSAALQRYLTVELANFGQTERVKVQQLNPQKNSLIDKQENGTYSNPTFAIAIGLALGGKRHD